MKRQQLLLLILAFGVFSILNTEMGIIGILPMAAEMYQVDIVQAGMLVSLFALGVAIAGPTMPLLFSRFNRKHVMLLVLGVFTICNALAVVASDFQLLLVLRVVPAFFHPVYCALAFSVAAASVAPEDAPRAVARINMGVAAGMVVGVSPKQEDITVNVCKKKQLTNTRAAGSDDALRLVPPRKLSLEQCLEFLADDELLEVTPKSLRIRKRILDHERRMKAAHGKGAK